MPTLTSQELQAFLSSGRPIMKIATLTPEGWPYVNPVWYDYDGETFRVAGRRKARWVSNIRHNPRVSLCIDLSEAPYTRVIMQAIAIILDNAWLPTSPERAIRYLGETAGRRYFEQTHNTPRALIRLTPQEVSTWSGSAWHPRYHE